MGSITVIFFVLCIYTLSNSRFSDAFTSRLFASISAGSSISPRSPETCLSLTQPLLTLTRSGMRLLCTSESFIPDKIVESSFQGLGSILVSQATEPDRFVSKGVLLIYEHNERGSLGVVLNKPTAFTMGETSPNIGVFEANTLFMGGNEGSDMAIMLHCKDLGGYAKGIGNGLYVGGLRHAREMVEAFKAAPKDFKFVFNNIQWAPGVLENEIEAGRWSVCKMPPHLILSQDCAIYDSLWSIARRALDSNQ